MWRGRRLHAPEKAPAEPPPKAKCFLSILLPVVIGALGLGRQRPKRCIIAANGTKLGVGTCHISGAHKGFGGPPPPPPFVGDALLGIDPVMNYLNVEALRAKALLVCGFALRGTAEDLPSQRYEVEWVVSNRSIGSFPSTLRH